MLTHTVTQDQHYGNPASPRALRPFMARTQIALLFLAGATSGLVFIEPSPFEIVIALTILFFTVTGLNFRAPLIPLALLLVFINIGYSTSAISFLDDQQVMSWVATSWFMAVTCLFYAAAMQADTEQRLAALMNGIMVAAVVAAVAGIIGYARHIPGDVDLLTYAGRARGTFKDPNVFGAFLILPSLIALQRMVLGDVGKALRNALILTVLSIGNLLAFSRGAWGQLAFSVALMLYFMFLTASSSRLRIRIVVMAVIVIAAAVGFLIALLSIDAVQALFKERASLNQSYDLGTQGRFGRHILGALLAFDRPLGIGPLQFSHYFPEDPHNSYLNAFMAGGWLAGVCYPVLTLLTLTYGFKHVFVATPWRLTYIAVYSAYVSTAFESYVIDSDHWRHYYLLIGLVWGLVVVGRPYSATRAAGGISLQPAIH